MLTADKTLMSEYDECEFLGFAACAPAYLPDFLFERLFSPPQNSSHGSAKFAPCGLRKVESVLIDNGFDVVTAHPDGLSEVIGEETKVLGISTNDPLGLGPASSTFVELAGKESYTYKCFRDLLKNPLIRKYDLSVAVGGPGAWQLEDERIRYKYNIDCVLIGEGEITSVKTFEKLLNGESVPRFVHGKVVPLEQIPTIKKPTINGLVEIARGCGRGCKFCNPTMQRYRCSPLDKILEEVRINLEAGNYPLLHAEDVLRYKANGVVPNESEVIRLFREVRRIASHINISHFTLSSVVAKPKLIEDISEILELPRKDPWLAGQTGIESGSPDIIDKYMRGKARPFSPEQWPEVVQESFKILDDNNWIPCATLVSGYPEETDKDVTKTIELVEDLSDYKSLIVPLFFVPIGLLEEEKFFGMSDMLPEHWMLLAACIKHDFRWVYELSRDYYEKNEVGRMRSGLIKIVTRLMHRKLKPYLRIMEQGENPLQEI